MSYWRNMEKQKALKGSLLFITVFFCLMSCLSIILGFRFLFGIFDGDATESSRLFLTINCANSIFNGAIWAIVARFVHLVRVRSEVFSRRQSYKFFVIAAIFFLRFIMGFFLPTIGVRGPAKALGHVLSSGPTVDLSMLSLTVLFFALGAVFEYGRILQEDSDNII